MDEQIGDIHEGDAVCELFDRVPAVAKDAPIAIDERDSIRT